MRPCKRFEFSFVTYATDNGPACTSATCKAQRGTDNRGLWLYVAPTDGAIAEGLVARDEVLAQCISCWHQEYLRPSLVFLTAHAFGTATIADMKAEHELDRTKRAIRAAGASDDARCPST